MIAEFFLPIEPRPWQRAGYNRKTRRFFTKSKTRNYETEVALRSRMYASQNGIHAIPGPIRVDLQFIMPRPKSHSKKQREICWHFSKPDIDNLEKAVMDAIRGIFFNDDNQVCAKNSVKIYAQPNQQPGIAVRIESLNDSQQGG